MNYSQATLMYILEYRQLQEDLFAARKLRKQLQDERLQKRFDNPVVELAFVNLISKIRTMEKALCVKQEQIFSSVIADTVTYKKEFV